MGYLFSLLGSKSTSSSNVEQYNYTEPDASELGIYVRTGRTDEDDEEDEYDEDEEEYQRRRHEDWW